MTVNGPFTEGLSTRIDARQDHALRVLAQIMGMKRADIIRLAVDEFIHNYSDPDKVQAHADRARQEIIDQGAVIREALGNIAIEEPEQ